MKPATDGSGRSFLNDLRGPLYAIENGNLTTYLDLRDHLLKFYDKRGLGGGFNFFAFHPEFATNGLFYWEAADLKLGALAPIKKFRVYFDEKKTTMAKLAGSGRVDLRIGIDDENELYVFEKNKGQIFKIAKVTASTHSTH